MHTHELHHMGSLCEWEFVTALSLDCVQVCAYIQIKQPCSFWGFFLLFLNRNDKKHQSRSLADSVQCICTQDVLVYLVTQGTALRRGWGVLRAATLNAVDGFPAADLSWASHPGGHQWSCVPLEYLNAWMALGNLVGWIYKYSYNRKDNSLVSVELWASRNLY